MKAFLAAFLLVSAAASAADIVPSKDCSSALRDFTLLLEKLPRHCEKDSDCKAFYIHPNSCAPPVPLNKSAEKSLDEEWNSHMKKIRAACASSWSQQSACAPMLIDVRCALKTCVPGMPQKPVFDTAEIEDACAPHDALSVSVRLKIKNTEYPSFNLNWWAQDRARKKAGRYVLKDELLTQFAASYCTRENTCRPVSKLRMEIELKGDGSFGELEYEFSSDGVSYKGKVPVKYVSRGQVICG